MVARNSDGKNGEVLTFPCFFFYNMVTPLNLEELDHFAPHDMTLLIQDLDRVLRIRQVSLKRCHTR
jgi:hypothetical protein